jgi:hypothetical protein
MPIILATQEAKIRRIAVHSQPGQIVPQDPLSKKPITQKIRSGEVVQGINPGFKSQHSKKKKIQKIP